MTTLGFYQESSFRYQRNGTSFLNRYWNDNNGSNCCGIETILHPLELGGPLKLNNSYIDRYYWNGENSCNYGIRIVNITFGSDEVHIDEKTTARYNLGTTIGRIYCTP
jgi:hypothetical protein